MTRRGWRRVLLGAVAGVLLFVLVRFAFAPFHQPTHHHANFLVYIDGAPLDLSADRFMEELGACRAADEVLPSERAHMHENVGDVVHVHHEGVTWGHFFAVLGFGLGDDWLVLPPGLAGERGGDPGGAVARILVPEGGRTFKYVVDGFVVPGVADRLIGSEDRVVISYGAETEEEVVAGQFAAVPTTAGEYNERDDPAGCAGPIQLTPMERLWRAIWG